MGPKNTEEEKYIKKNAILNTEQEIVLKTELLVKNK